MKKFWYFLSLSIIAVSMSAADGSNSFSAIRNNKSARGVTADVKIHKSDSICEAVGRLYETGKISADSVINLAMYHKVWSPRAAEGCLRPVAETGNLRGAMELGVLYAFSPEYANRASDGVKLLQAVAKAGYNDANAYLGLYYFTHKDYKKAKACFDACGPENEGFGYAALGSMYLEGRGVGRDAVKARENYHQSALKGYPRGMSLYGFNQRASAAGSVNYPESFFWLYIAGDLGDDAARTALYLPRRNENRGDSETAQKALTALQFIETAQSGKNIKNEPIYKDGFLVGLKSVERAADGGDDWARFYLGSMNYNGEFLNQNYARAYNYYMPIVRNGKLPKNVLALVHERLARMYREGKGVRANTKEAASHTCKAAQYGSLAAYKTVEHINQ